MQPTISNIPKHIGIILDGNRRFAKRLLLKPWKGHEWGASKVKKMLTWAKELDIKEVTFYAFSIENFNRPKKEFDYLMDLFAKEFRTMGKDPRLKQDGICINFLGRIHLFPEFVQKEMHNLMNLSKTNTKFFVNFAMAYGGRAEIIDATKKIAQQIKEGKIDVTHINEKLFEKHLYTDSEPDLIIRTSGEQRISGFMLWQGSYAEYYFCPKLWPEFEKEDFVEAIHHYSNRNRRFGK
jgi:tritrans,polycis-undecaprenyl-diphosphate synthase [geranylgeranyl-diphosphate specific]